MHLASSCPICKGSNIKTIRKYRFKHPHNSRSGIENFKVGKLLDFLRARADHAGQDSYASRRLEILFELIGESKGEAVFGMELCNSCGFLYLNPRMEDADIARKYALLGTHGKTSRPPSQNQHIQRRRRRMMKTLTPYLPDSGGMILDVGGAPGNELLPFIDKHHCFLLDYEQNDIPPGINYLGRTAGDLTSEHSFDVIMLNNVLEHLPNPLDVIAALKSHLKPNGIIYVEVPWGSLIEWRMLTEPMTHLQFFSEQSLAHLFLAAGMNSIVATVFQEGVTYQTWQVTGIAKNTSADPVLPASILSTERSMLSLSHLLRAAVSPTNLVRAIRIGIRGNS